MSATACWFHLGAEREALAQLFRCNTSSPQAVSKNGGVARGQLFGLLASCAMPSPSLESWFVSAPPLVRRHAPSRPTASWTLAETDKRSVFGRHECPGRSVPASCGERQRKGRGLLLAPTGPICSAYALAAPHPSRRAWRSMLKGRVARQAVIATTRKCASPRAVAATLKLVERWHARSLWLRPDQGLRRRPASCNIRRHFVNGCRQATMQRCAYG